MKPAHPECVQSRARIRVVRAAGAVGISALLALVGCADMSGIRPHAVLRDAPSLGLVAGEGATALD
ncbi:MAG: RND transporter, partial [Rhodoferax sp.]